VSPKAAVKTKAMGLYAFRLPDPLMTDVDRYARQLEAETPGLRITRADAVRALLIEGLAQVAARKAGC
jgi:hypothetical protein